tara:strand:+ start:8158 stop:8904 length:747 start_codon:yes stop_codon:yes gene_type:complete
MNITEIEPTKKIVISKFDFTCDDVDCSIPEPLPQGNFFMILSGKSGSGKTSLLLNLLTKRGKNLNRKFDKIFLFGNSFKTIKDDPFGELPEEQKLDSLEVDNLQDTLDAIRDSEEKILFVMDDVVNDITKNATLKNMMNKMIMNRRHLCGTNGSVSVIITTQVYNKIPRPIRANADKIVIYHTKNKKELETLFDEVIVIPKDEFYEVLKYTFDRPHNFLYIDTNKSFDNMLHKNFNQLQFTSKDTIKY